VFVPSSACESYSTFVPYFVPILVSSSSYDDNEDENRPPPAHPPLDESIKLEPAPTPPLPRWAHSTREAASDLVGDPSNQRRTSSHFQ
jgi:hypothetical protein